MTELAIHFIDETSHETCALCGMRTVTGRGPQLFRVHSTEVVCRRCGKKHAPRWSR